MQNWRSLFVRISNPALISLIWLGISAGITFVAIPAVFNASAMNRVAALGVARSIFEALGQTELIALILLLVAVRVSDKTRECWSFLAAIALIQIAHSSWLLPALSARTDMIISGVEPPASFLHGTYGVLQLLKLLLLFILSIRLLPPTRAKKELNQH